MRIISKYRDYYDHLVFYYGYDETRVYDRRGDCVSDPFSWSMSNQIVISICGTYYPLFIDRRDKKIHFEYDKSIMDHYDCRFFNLYKDVSSDVNVKYRQPVAVECSKYIHDHKNPRKSTVIQSYWIPVLSNFKIPSIIDANTMYENIYNFLGWLKDNPQPPNNQTDKDKIVAHGFDCKNSFRPKIKI